MSTMSEVEVKIHVETCLKRKSIRVHSANKNSCQYLPNMHVNTRKKRIYKFMSARV